MLHTIIVIFICINATWSSGSMTKKKSYHVKVNTTSHKRLQKVYDQYLVDGKVDYIALKKNRDNLDKYLEQMAYIDLSTMNRNETLALYLNIYNAYTLQLVIDHYPMKVTDRSKPKESILQIPRVWDDFMIDISNELMSLNELEHKHIRKFQDPRVHFAMVCAAQSCPKIQSRVFTAKSLNSQLNKARDEFLKDPVNYHYCKDCKTIRLSKIFEWFKEDFQKHYKRETRRYQKSAGVMGFILDRMPKELKSQFLSKKPEVVYSDYDWRLNKQ